MTQKYILGLDLGSVSLDAAVLNDKHELIFSRYVRVNAAPRQALKEMAMELSKAFPDGFQAAVVTGSGKDLVNKALDIAMVNEIVAHGFFAAMHAGDGRISVIEIGGQDSKFITVDAYGPVDYAMNEVCAAGTGSFLDVQAERLGLDIKEFAELAAKATEIPPVAGRCSVFAKTDIIHLQQKGVPVDQIAAGLCYALARNYLAGLVRGRRIYKPVFFQGGVANNKAVVKAFRELLDLDPDQMVIPENPGLAGAIGSALLAQKQGKPLSADTLSAFAGSQSGPKVLVEVKKGLNKDMLSEALEVMQWSRRPRPGEDVLIGVDVGSVSTDAVVMDTNGELLGWAYLMTAGQPLRAITRAMEFFGKVLDPKDVLAVGTTGSGRHLAKAILNADLAVDEITAQTGGVAFVYPDTDTIIEIGGQDSKFIRVRAGEVDSFEMNRACAAGTGSFLQEQAYRLSIDLKKEFATLAMSATQVPRLNAKCTVFMESDLVHHVQQGVDKAGLAAGLANSVVRNYIETTASGKAFGKNIVLTGGVAHNAAVVKAFMQEFPDSKVTTHPHPGLSGAMGAGLLAGKMHKGRTSFTGFGMPADLQVSSFECSQCENLCEVNVFNLKGKKHYFGDLCGMYSERTLTQQKGHDLVERAAALLNSALKVQSHRDKGKPVVAFPEALLFKDLMPFYYEFFKQLGFRIVSSGPVTKKKLDTGLRMLPAEVCLPVKVMFGQVAYLLDHGFDRIFIPNPSTGEEGVMCPYVNGAGSMLKSAFNREFLMLPLVPGRRGSERDYLVHRASLLLERDKSTVEKALKMAEEAQGVFRRVIQETPDQGRKTALLLGKPYNAGDRFVNLTLTSKLAARGFDVIAWWQIPQAFAAKPDEEMPPTWQFSRRMVRAARYALTQPMVFPVIVTNFGCGPDAFTVNYIQQTLGERPHIVLEFDEHRQDAGLDTRLDAFTHRVNLWLERNDESRVPKQVSVSVATAKRKDSKVFLPYFAPHVHAFAGALEAEGIESEILPLPDDAALQLAEQVTGGNECHPFKLIMGDLVKLERAGRLPKNSAYLFPVVLTSKCIVTQYQPAMTRFINLLGRPDVDIIGAAGTTLLERFGFSFVMNLDKGLIAVDYLYRYKRELTPYAKDKKLLQTAFEKGLEAIHKGQAKDEILSGVDQAIQWMKQVPVDKSSMGQRPIIGIVGDVYTRVNPAANLYLFNMLEDLGCEVWPAATVIDVSIMGTQIEVRDYIRTRQLRSLPMAWAQTAIQEVHLRQIRNRFEGLVRNLVDMDGSRIARLTQDIFPDNADLLVRLNLGEAVDFALKGVHGIINAFCQNCMVGTSSAAVFGKLKPLIGDIPLMSLVFSGQEDTHVRNRVEAFVYRARRYKAERDKRE